MTGAITLALTINTTETASTKTIASNLNEESAALTTTAELVRKVAEVTQE